MAVLAVVVVGGPILISLLMSTDWSLCCPPGTIIIISQIRLQMRSPPTYILSRPWLLCPQHGSRKGRESSPTVCGRMRRKDSEVFDEKTPLSNICGLFNIYVGQGTHIPPTRSACLFMATPQADSFLNRLLGTLWSATD